MLSIKSIPNVFTYVYLVNHLVCILLQSSGENNNLIVLCHGFNEFNTTWPHKEETIILVLNVVYKSLIKIKHECVSVFFIFTQWI